MTDGQFTSLERLMRDGFAAIDRRFVALDRRMEGIEKIMDMARLLAKSFSIPEPALVIASLMANEAADHADEEDPRTSFKDAWREIMLTASALFITSSSPTGRS